MQHNFSVNAVNSLLKKINKHDDDWMFVLYFCILFYLFYL